MKSDFVLKRYASRSGGSGIVAHAAGPAGMAVEFVDGSVYVYDTDCSGEEAVAEMKRLAKAGEGLLTYISRLVRDRYTQKLL